MDFQRTNPGIAAGIGVNYRASGKDASRAAVLDAQSRALSRRGAALGGLASAVGKFGESLTKSSLVVGNANVDSDIADARIRHNEQERQKKILDAMQKAEQAALKTDTGLTMKQVGIAYDSLSSKIASEHGKFESEEQFAAYLANAKAEAENEVYSDVATPREGGVNFRNWNQHQGEVKNTIELTIGKKFFESELAKFRVFKTKESVGKVNSLLEGMSSSGQVHGPAAYQSVADGLAPILGEEAANRAAKLHYEKGTINAAKKSYSDACAAAVQFGQNHFDALLSQGYDVDYAREVGISRARESLSRFVPYFGRENEGGLQVARRILTEERFFEKLDSSITSHFKGLSEAAPANMIADFRSSVYDGGEPIYAQTREFNNLFSQEGAGREDESYYFSAAEDALLGQRELHAVAEADIWQADVMTSRGQKEILKTLKSAQTVMSPERYAALCETVKQKFANAGRDSPDKNSVKERLMGMMGIKKWSDASPDQKQFIESTVIASQKNTLGLTTDDFLNRQFENYNKSRAMSRSANSVIADIYSLDLSGAGDTFSSLFEMGGLSKASPSVPANAEEAAPEGGSSPAQDSSENPSREGIVTAFSESGVLLTESEQAEAARLAQAEADRFRVSKRKTIKTEDGGRYEFFAEEEEVEECRRNAIRRISISMLHEKQKLANEANARRAAEESEKRLREEDELRREFEILKKEGFLPSPFALPFGLGSLKSHVEFMRRQKAAKDARRRKEESELAEHDRKAADARERLNKGK